MNTAVVALYISRSSIITVMSSTSLGHRFCKYAGQTWTVTLFSLPYAFTAPFVRPLTIYFCMKIKISTTGMMATIPNAMVAFHRV